MPNLCPGHCIMIATQKWHFLAAMSETRSVCMVAECNSKLLASKSPKLLGIEDPLQYNKVSY